MGLKAGIVGGQRIDWMVTVSGSGQWLYVPVEASHKWGSVLFDIFDKDDSDSGTEYALRNFANTQMSGAVDYDRRKGYHSDGLRQA